MAKSSNKAASKAELSKSAKAKREYYAAKAAKKAAQAARLNAPPSPEPVAPVPAKPKRPRYVRTKTEERPPAATIALPPRSSKLHVKLMSKGLALPPKEENNLGLNSMR